jgi:hypothetical protein
MTDTSPRNQSALRWNAKPAAARQPRPGETAWRLRHADGRVRSCELRNHVDAGVDVLFYQGDDLLFSYHYLNDALARDAAAAMKQDQMRSDWIEDAAGAMQCRE